MDLHREIKQKNYLKKHYMLEVHLLCWGSRVERSTTGSVKQSLANVS